MPSLEVWWGALFGTALGAAGLLILVDGLARLRKIVRLTVASPTDVASLSAVGDGTMKVSGTVREAKDLVTAPLSGTRCCLCRTAVKYYSATNAPRWRTVTTDVRGRRFELADATGRVTVDAADADLKIDPAVEGECPSDRDAAPERLRPLLTRDDGEPYATVRLTRRHLRIVERRLDPGTDVTALVSVAPDGSVVASRIGGIDAASVARDVAVALFLVLFGLFLVSVLWFVALPNWGTIL